MFKLKNGKHIDIESTLKTKTNRIIKKTQTLKNPKRKEEKEYLSSNQYKLMIYGLEKLNNRIQKEISNFEKITNLPDFADLSIKNKERKIPFLSFGEYQKEFFEIFKNFDLNLICLKKTIKNQKTIKNSFLIRLKDLLKKNKDFENTLNNFSKKNIDFDFDKNNSLSLIKKRTIINNYKNAAENQKEIKTIYNKKQNNNNLELDYLKYTINLYKDDEKIKECNIEVNLDLKEELHKKIIKIEKLIKVFKIKKEYEIKENQKIKEKNDNIILEIEEEKEKIKNEQNEKIFFNQKKIFLEKIKPNHRIEMLNDDKEDFDEKIKNKNFERINLENDLDLNKKKQEKIKEFFKNIESERKEKNLEISEIEKNLENLKNQEKSDLIIITKKEESIKFAKKLLKDKKKEKLRLKSEIENNMIKSEANLKSIEFEKKIDYLENKSLKEQSSKLLSLKIENLINNIKKEKFFENDLKKQLKKKIFNPDFDCSENEKLSKKKIEINLLKQKILILKYDDEKRSLEMLKNDNDFLLKKKNEKNKKLNFENLNYLEKKKKNVFDIGFFKFKILNNNKKIDNLKNIILNKKLKIKESKNTLLEIQNLYSNESFIDKNDSFVKENIEPSANTRF